MTMMMKTLMMMMIMMIDDVDDEWQYKAPLRKILECMNVGDDEG